jgi:hypothetical protein
LNLARGVKFVGFSKRTAVSVFDCFFVNMASGGLVP